MSCGKRHRMLLAGVFGVLMSANAAAEPVTITGGDVETFLSLQLARILFEGDDFSLRTSSEDFRAELISSQPCAAEGSVTLGATWRFGSFRAADAVVDGVAYDGIRVGDYSGDFTTAAIPLLVTDQIVRVPFAFSGVVSGFLTESDPPVFTKTLTGAGTATARFIVPGPGLIHVEGLRYDFAPAAPVPEPATVVLVSAGLAFAARRRMRPSPPSAEAGSTR